MNDMNDMNEMASHPPQLSVVIPLFDERDNVAPLIERLAESLDGIDHEVIFVDDGSVDDTVAQLRQHARPGSRIVEFARNYGQTMALAAGIDAAGGDLIVTLDGDLQNDPADIPLMMQRMAQGDCDLVAGIRQKRQDGMLLRKIPSQVANWLIRRLTGVAIQDYGCTLKLFRPRIAKNLGLYGELHRYMPVLASLRGARIVQMPVRHHPRVAGTSKYGLNRTLKVLSDLLLMVFMQKYGQRPMHLFGGSGILLFLSGMGINCWLLIEKLFGADIGGRPLLLLGVLLTIFGVQLISLGLLSDLIMRTYHESQGKKPYQVKQETIVPDEPSTRG
jgi:glycosyltransferase involved in cell wall biosynthesis